jgi:nucleoside phosphorylase
MATPPETRFDVAIVCALRLPELQKVRRTGKEPWEDVPSHPDDPTGYYRTTYTTKRGKRLSVVAAAPTRMGTPASAVLATKMIRRFRPALVALVGIAVGARSDKQGLGDILAPDFTFDYNAGKVTMRDGKLYVDPDPQPLHIQARLMDRLKHWSSERPHLDDICNRWPATRPRSRLEMHVGPLGSGAAVVDARQPIVDILDHWRKLIGVEMEAYGVHLACQDAAQPETAFLCLKSICDFAADKSDDWQDYAAYTAAELCHRFLTDEWEDLHLEPAAPG